MPLVVTDFRAIEEEPLSRLILHAGLGKLDLNGIIWMTNNFNDLGLPPAADLTVQTIEQVQSTSYKLPSPSFVSNTMGPEVLLVEWRPGRNSVTHEAACGVRVHAEQEWDEEMVSVPEGLKGLLSNPVVGRGIDQQHAKQHDVSSDAASFCVVDLESDLRSDLALLDVEEVDIMASCMNNSEDKHGIRDLSMEPH